MSPKMVIITIAILPLLLFINTKQTSAQAPAPAYGLGGYTMDGQDQQMNVPHNARLLKIADDVNKYKTNDHANKQFKPCKVIYNGDGVDDLFQVFYDEDTAIEGCTVDFVFNEIGRISAKIAVTDTGLACLKNCGNGNDEWTASNANLVPFTYSRSNEEIKKLHNGPPYNEDQKSCKKECVANSGKCMASPTSLQFAMNKCASKVTDWIHLVGEPLSSWSISRDVPTPSHSATFGLTIATGNTPTITIKNGESVNEPRDAGRNPVKILNCFTDADDKLPVPIPVPQFWTIKSASNPELNGKHLLVFHLLPQAATRVFNEKGQLQNDQPPAPEMPKCKGKLSITISNALGILQSVPPPTTTTQTTEMMTSIGTTSGGTTATASGGATNNKTTTATNKEKSEMTCTVWMIVAFVACAILLLNIVANVILVWCLCCRNKKQKDAEIGEAPVKKAKKAKQKADDDDSDEDARNEEEHEGWTVPESVYCKGVSVPDTVQTDYVE